MKDFRCFMSVGGKKNNGEATNVASLKRRRELVARKRQELAMKEMEYLVKGLEKVFKKQMQLEVEPNVINITDKLNKKKLN